MYYVIVMAVYNVSFIVESGLTEAAIRSQYDTRGRQDVTVEEVSEDEEMVCISRDTLELLTAEADNFVDSVVADEAYDTSEVEEAVAEAREKL